MSASTARSDVPETLTPNFGSPALATPAEFPSSGRRHGRITLAHLTAGSSPCTQDARQRRKLALRVDWPGTEPRSADAHSWVTVSGFR